MSMSDKFFSKSATTPQETIDPRKANRPYFDLSTEELMRRINANAYNTALRSTPEHKALIAELFARESK
jgi:hypothetical protein